MRARPHLPSRPHRLRQHGAGLIETMVGILIGFVVLLVVYNVFALSEGYKRTTVGAADMQVNGQFAQFILSREITSAGNGMMFGLADLWNCNPIALKAIPVLIRAAATNDDTDDLVITYSNAPRILHPVAFTSPAPSAGPFEVQSPNGFAVNDWVIATDRAGTCRLAKVTAVAPFSGPPDPLGRVNVDYTPATGFVFPANSRLVNMGANWTRVEYTVRPRPTPNPYLPQLRSQDVNPGVAVQPIVPITSDVVLIKAQYGIDQFANNTVSCWTPADNSNTCPLDPLGANIAVDYSAGVLDVAGTAQAIGSIKAVRIAVVVRSNEPDPRNTDLMNQTQWLFNCSVNTTPGCPGRIQIDNTVLQDFFRYRVYETTVPLRNSLWN